MTPQHNVLALFAAVAALLLSSCSNNPDLSSAEGAVSLKVSGMT